ncbi:UDP-N-acetylglucosamine 1-carboxyvinyltransferase [bacterium]|nr:UDP-N-acetylglucosamine 1-carboxyvinyltransferase [bacterium]
MAGLVVIGGTALHGEVAASGAKNAALPLLAATLMMRGDSELTNVPHLMDVITMVKMLNSLGVRADLLKGNRVSISNTKKVRHIAPYELVTAMRASFFVAGPLVAYTGFAKVPLPGGCSIGSRPIDIHLTGFEQLGIRHRIEHGFVELQAKTVKGGDVYLPFPSVGATENVMMAATIAEGHTTIHGAACEPEIIDLGHLLNRAGGKITGCGTPTIQIEGVSGLSGTHHAVMPDRIEAGSLLLAGVMTGGDVTVTHCTPDDCTALLDCLTQTGLCIETGPNWMRARHGSFFRGVTFETQPHPGFPTDMQAQMMALLTLADGQSIVKESIFENRFMHANELMRMGAKIKLDHQHAIITGVSALTGCEVKMTDLRAGAALVLAGLAAHGETRIHGLKHLRRGYDDFPGKLRALGATMIE